MSAGLFAGMVVGALPGFTTLMAMAILLPISFFLDPIVGIPFLLGVSKGGIFGGSVPAILISMPGTGAAVATSLDGYQLTKKGQSRKALDIALVSSVFGDLSSDVVTILAIGPIALIAMRIGPPELAAVLFLSLVIIAVTGSGRLVKGLLMMVLGLLISLIGQDPIGALSRFTFDVFQLRSGIPLLPMLIGVFALPEVLIAVEKRATQMVRAAAGVDQDRDGADTPARVEHDREVDAGRDHERDAIVSPDAACGQGGGGIVGSVGELGEGDVAAMPRSAPARELGDGPVHLGVLLAIEGVEPLRAVELQDRDRSLAFDDQGHGVLLFLGLQPERRRGSASACFTTRNAKLDCTRDTPGSRVSSFRCTRS